MWWGADGASYAVLISETLVTTVQVYMIHRELKFPGIWVEVLKYIMAAAIMFGVVLWLQALIAGWLSIIVCVALGATVYFVILFILKAQILLFAKEMLRK